MHFVFGSKAHNLAALVGKLDRACLLPQLAFSVGEWRLDQERCMRAIGDQPWSSGALAVRSSAQAEDQLEGSLAGKFDSRLDVRYAPSLRDAIEAVISSYGKPDDRDEVLIQPMIESAQLAGVAFSHSPKSNAPYITINATRSGDTTSITSGSESPPLTFFAWKASIDGIRDAQLKSVADLLIELEQVTGLDRLDVEFAIDVHGRLFLLQVRPLVLEPQGAGPTLTTAHLNTLRQKVEVGMQPHPYLHGRRTVFGVMPDWNPAEIIGVRPHPLALSLYSDLITDAVWAYQRNNYGYKNLRSFPLMVNFYGQPYIDVRVSFNSFLPRDLNAELSERLINHYLDSLINAPALHDKVEFEIIHSCYTLDIDDRLNPLLGQGFSDRDVGELKERLRTLTNRIIDGENGLWRDDAEKIEILAKRREQILGSSLDRVSRMYWLLEDCKRYGTLPFAGLARAGFIAIQLLRSLVNVGVLSDTDYDLFMGSLNTVSSRMSHDFAQLGRADFLARYGHLRPGTYDIQSPRYDEAPDHYFDWTQDNRGSPRPEQRFSLTLPQMRKISELLKQHALNHDVVGLFEFIKAGIEGREYAKFVFTHSLSDALSLLKTLGSELGFSTEDLSYADISVLRTLYTGCGDARSMLATAIEQGRQNFRLTSQLILPPLITEPDDVLQFALPASEPNFITLRQAVGPVRDHERDNDLSGGIVLIPSADPGFDWIFSRGIAAFITAYGGANSHMAIRAGELGIPAVVGAGEALFRRWSSARRLLVDAANHQVRVLQ